MKKDFTYMHVILYLVTYVCIIWQWMLFFCLQYVIKTHVLGHEIDGHLLEWRVLLSTISIDIDIFKISMLFFNLIPHKYFTVMYG